MNSMSGWLTSLTLAALTTWPATASQPTSQHQPFPKDTESLYQLAQVSGQCLEVQARSGLYVRQQPTVYSTAITALANGRNVTVAGPPANNWVPISAPVSGYVFANYLAPCQSSPVPISNLCREVTARSGLSVRQQPSGTSDVVTVLPYGRNVTIENRGVQGWVPISTPVEGYVSANYLRYCS